MAVTTRRVAHWVVVRSRLRVVAGDLRPRELGPAQAVGRRVCGFAARHLEALRGCGARVEEYGDAAILYENIVGRRAVALKDAERRLRPRESVGALGEADPPVRDGRVRSRRHARAFNAVVIQSVRTSAVAGQALASTDGTGGGVSPTAEPAAQAAASGKSGRRVDAAALESVASARYSPYASAV